METRKMKLALSAGAIALSLALAGCGGGGSPQSPTQAELDAQEAMKRAEMQTAAIMSAISDAQTAIGAIDADSPMQAQVTAAATAVTAAQKAIADAADVDDTSSYAATVMALDNSVKVAQKAVETGMSLADAEAAQKKAEDDLAAKEEADRIAMEEADRKAMAAAGKALKAALKPTSEVTLTSLGASGLMLTFDAGGPDNDPAARSLPPMKAGESAGMLGDWDGKHYSHTNAGTKVSNSAVVYTNQGAPTVKPFATGASFGADENAFDSAYTASTRTLDLGNSTSSSAIKGDMFPTAGTTTYTPDSVTNVVVVRGTYQGAPGSYRCTGTECMATAGTGSAITLDGADWSFVHDAGAMTSRADADYLYFGWWLQKNKDDKPTAASAFAGVTGMVTASTNPTLLSGTATYTGHAAGKFAISDTLTGGDAGHFTADATLTAKFGTAATETTNNSNGLTGTLDNFMANDKSVPWSVSLLRANLNGTGGTVAFNDPDTASVDESATQTVWSIDGTSAAASGSWTAQMYDEKPGPAPSGDGSNVPTTVTGTFQSHFDGTHSMVGAFGATK